MLEILADKGVVRSPHQTPLEFAYGTGLGGTVYVTERYQDVRFGRRELSADEARELDGLVEQIAQI